MVHSLLTDKANDASDFLNWKELPQHDVHDRMKACKCMLTVQTSSSRTRFRNDLTVETDLEREIQQRNGTSFCFHQKARKAVSLDQASHLTSGPVPRNSKRLGQVTPFPKMEKDCVQHWCHFHNLLEDHCSIHWVRIPSIE